MKLFDGLASLPRPAEPATVAIGTFDGVHVGHQAIIRTAVTDAAARSARSLVFTFDRHPADLLAPERAPDYLSTPSQRAAHIAALGVDGLVIARFDHDLASLPPEAFLEEIVRDRLGATAIVVGDNFSFGRNRAGTVALLEACQDRLGYRLTALPPVMVDGAPASSTRIRELLRAGEIEEAERVLGHAYWLEGTVVPGRRLGRELGFPTANLARAWRQVVPLDGIYAVRVRLDDGRELSGACSIGDRPTVDGAGRSIETFLLDFDEDIYGSAMSLRFVRRLRSELKFESLDALRRQMALDVVESRRILADLE
ncbi:MAG TPA: bifunctional riboflavin kinase/FAD synthetase [Chthonomonadaceae bacterium]|nr:bifunctional riboflavin kinase/FAD synthetase [Chthonomonadaceae bacterium]